jgi:hypothetical protein
MKIFLNLQNLKNSIFCISLIIFSSTVYASSWHLVTSFYSKEIALFFDAESVERQADYRFVWYKIVRKQIPDSEGAWSTATRYKVDCKNKTVQNLTTSDYDVNNKFIKSYPMSPQIKIPIPDSLADEVVKLSCKSNFPNDKSEASPYFKLKDNDVFRATRFLTDFDNGNIDKAPQ